MNRLKILRFVEFGAYLDDGDKGILLPIKQLPPDSKEEDELDVFVYTDSEDRPIATMEKPLAMSGEFALLQVVSTDRVGAFVDIGLQKDLLIPYSEMNAKLRKGQRIIVRVYTDPTTNRLVGSTIYNKFLRNKPENIKPGDEITGLVALESELGVRIIVDHKYWGLIYHESVQKQLVPGTIVTAWVKNVREDGRIDLTLRRPGAEELFMAGGLIIAALDKHNGRINVSDDSTPEEIKELLGISKKTFKRAAGMLFKDGRIEIQNGYIKKLK
ncbi:MAG: S1-like domain-containing RNA-binding protein [Bacteroidales bacterium]|nr:S1-like domain-containing RNA-binding protein [Bacteroidales bacterium]